MSQAISLLQEFERVILSELQESEYLYADTRIPWVSLYDHLALTAAFAVAMVAEMLKRGYDAENSRWPRALKKSSTKQ